MAMSNVVLTDGQGTPVNHTFTPQEGQNGDRPALWLNKAAGTTLKLWERLESFVSLGKVGGQHRATERLILPRTYTEAGVEKVGSIKLFITIQADEQVATTANLNDAWTMGKDLLAETVSSLAFKDLSPQSM